MNVDAIMTRHVVSVSMDDNLDRIRKVFAAKRFHHLLVMEENHRLVGIISDRDLLKAISPNIDKDSACARDLATLNKKAHQIMSRHPVVLESGTSVAHAVDLMIGKGLSCLPVVNATGAAIGIVSWKDVLRYLALLKAPALAAQPS